MKKISRFLTAIGITGILTVPSFLPREEKAPQRNPNPVKTEKTILEKDTVKNPVLTIKYKTDTLYEAKTTLMYYIPNEIIRNYVEDNNSFRMQLPYFAHEEWHRHNAGSLYRYNYQYSPEEYYKLCMHDEITSNISAILTARFEYLSSPDKAATIAKYENTYMGFYFKAVKEGKINPESTSPKDNEAEWRFIANGTKDMWMRTYAAHYSPTTLSMLKNYIERQGMLPSNPKNYNAIKNYMYTIGGVNFANYLEQDIEYKSDDLTLVENLSKVESLKSMKKQFVEEVLKNVPLLSSLEPSLRISAIQHVIVAAALKTSINEEDSPKVIQANLSVQYNKIMHNLSRDVTLNSFVTNYSINEVLKHPGVKDEVNYEDVINQIYTHKGVKLNEYIRGYSIDRVPHNFVWQGRNYSFVNMLEKDYFVSVWQNNKLKTDGVKFISPEAAPKPEKPRRRLSEEQQINIPNLRDPLLTSMTPEQRDSLYQMLQDFENIPPVLKSCNTKEIEKYKKQYAQKKKIQKQKNKSRAQRRGREAISR